LKSASTISLVANGVDDFVGHLNGLGEHGVIGRRPPPFALMMNTADAPSAQLSVTASARPFGLHSAS
jgi:hypothetical protein